MEPPSSAQPPSMEPTISSGEFVHLLGAQFNAHAGAFEGLMAEAQDLVDQVNNAEVNESNMAQTNQALMSDMYAAMQAFQQSILHVHSKIPKHPHDENGPNASSASCEAGG